MLTYQCSGRATSLCADDEVNNSIDYPYALRDPAGRYHSPDGPKFDSAEDAFAYLKARASRKTATS
jgi:hypothetical protein